MPASKKPKREKLDKRPAQTALARRLRELRVVNGFKTARSFAQSLGIDENRYTRYERAEVEPDLTFIRLFAAALKTTPSDLLGSQAAASGGFAEEGETGGLAQSSGQSGVRASRTNVLAWSLAEAVTDARAKDRVSDAAPGTEAQLQRLQAISELYQQLSQDPFGTVGKLVRDPIVSGADATLLDRIQELTAGLTRSLAADAQRR